MDKVILIDTEVPGSNPVSRLIFYNTLPTKKVLV